MATSITEALATYRQVASNAASGIEARADQGALGESVLGHLGTRPGRPHLAAQGGGFRHRQGRLPRNDDQLGRFEFLMQAGDRGRLL